MMERMSRSRVGTTRRRSTRGRSAAWGVAGVLVVALAGCTSPSPAPPQPSSDGEPVALRVTTAPGGARQLSSTERSELEGAVGEVLTGYLVSSYLGDYPRDRFVESFDVFTGGAADLAAQHLDVLTGSRLGEATAVHPRSLEAELYFGVEDGDVFGATAHIDFSLEAAIRDGTTQDVSLTGRLMLTEQDGRWAVFGFDLAGDDGAPLGEEAP
jgi:hypothetical protein